MNSPQPLRVICSRVADKQASPLESSSATTMTHGFRSPTKVAGSTPVLCSFLILLNNQQFWFFKHQRTRSFHERTSKKLTVRKGVIWFFSEKWTTKVLYQNQSFKKNSPRPCVAKWVYTQIDNWQVSVADSNTHTTLVHTLHLPVVFVEITFPALPASLADSSSLVSNYHCKHYTSIQKPHSNVRVFASTSCHICLLCSNASFSGVNMRPAFCLS